MRGAHCGRSASRVKATRVCTAGKTCIITSCGAVFTAVGSNGIRQLTCSPACARQRALEVKRAYTKQLAEARKAARNGVSA